MPCVRPKRAHFAEEPIQLQSEGHRGLPAGLDLVGGESHPLVEKAWIAVSARRDPVLAPLTDATSRA
jgi:hypothetical protein